MDSDGVKVLVYAIVIASVIGGIGLTYLFSRKVGPDERVVVYRLGKTRRHLIHHDGQRAVAIPLIHHAVRAEGELREAWDEVHRALPRTWWVARPEHDEWGGGWSVRAGAPTGTSDRRGAEGSGRTEAEALSKLAKRIAAVLDEPALAADSAEEQVFGGDEPGAGRRYLRNPYRLPIHGNHFFLLPESWYEEGGPTGRYSRNGMLETIDILATLGPPFTIALMVFQQVMRR